MAIQSSGAISLNDMHVEAGGTSGTQASINDSDIRGLINKASGAQMSFNEWYGASGDIYETLSGTGYWSYDDKNLWFDLELGALNLYASDGGNIGSGLKFNKRMYTTPTSGFFYGSSHFLRVDQDGNFDWIFRESGGGFNDPAPIRSDATNFQTWWDTIDVYHSLYSSSTPWFTVTRNDIFDPNTSASIRLSRSNVSNINSTYVGSNKFGSSGTSVTNISAVVNYNTQPTN